MNNLNNNNLSISPLDNLPTFIELPENQNTNGPSTNFPFLGYAVPMNLNQIPASNYNPLSLLGAQNLYPGFGSSVQPSTTFPLRREVSHPVFSRQYFTYFKYQEIFALKGAEAALAFHEKMVQSNPTYQSFIPEIKSKELYQSIYKTQLTICNLLLSFLSEESKERPSLFNEYREMKGQIELIEKIFTKESNPAEVKPVATVAQISQILPEVDYLMNWEDWKIRLSFRLTPEEIKEPVIAAIQVMQDEMENELDSVIEKVFSRGAELTYLNHVKLGDLDFNQRKEVEGCFIATILRHIFLKNHLTDVDPIAIKEKFKDKLLNEYQQIMTGNISEEELLYLARFEQAILLAKTYISGNRNKGLFLVVGNLLEGSDNFTRYITGGHSSDETRRRVLLIENLCDNKPRKRARKLIASNNYFPSMNLSEVITCRIAESNSHTAYFKFKEALDKDDFVEAENIHSTLDRNFEPLCKNSAEYKTYCSLQLELNAFEMQSNAIELSSLENKLIEGPHIATAYKTMQKQKECLQTYQDILQKHLSESEAKEATLDTDMKV